MIVANCNICDSEFEKKVWNAKYCSKQCKSKYDNRVYSQRHYKKKLESNRKSWQKNKEKHIAKNKEWKEANKERVKELNKRWKQENKERYNKTQREWRKHNNYKEYQKEYYYKNHSKIRAYQKQYREENDNVREYFNTYSKNRKDTDILFKITGILRTRIGEYFKGKSKSKTTAELIGCTPEHLKQHLEKQFDKDMSWDNYGLYGWHIDHIIPLASAKTEQELYSLCHYTNLQPLWAEDNLSKGSKLN